MSASLFLREINADDLSDVSPAHLNSADNWQAQYRYLTSWGGLIQPKPTLRCADLLLKGCETAAWLGHLQRGEQHYFFFDSDSRIIKGLAALVLSQVEGKTAEAIASLDLHDLLHSGGLAKHLTPSRNNGIAALIVRVQDCAKV